MRPLKPFVHEPEVVQLQGAEAEHAFAAYGLPDQAA
jgi:hypothetical protein